MAVCAELRTKQRPVRNWKSPKARRERNQQDEVEAAVAVEHHHETGLADAKSTTRWFLGCNAMRWQPGWLGAMVTMVGVQAVEAATRCRLLNCLPPTVGGLHKGLHIVWHLLAAEEVVDGDMDHRQVEGSLSMHLPCLGAIRSADAGWVVRVLQGQR
jgi:hypothetical protein